MISRRSLLGFLGVAPVAAPVVTTVDAAAPHKPWPVLPVESELRTRSGGRVIIFGILPLGHVLGLHEGNGRILQGMAEDRPGVWYGMAWFPNGKYFVNEPRFDLVGLHE